MHESDSSLHLSACPRSTCKDCINHFQFFIKPSLLIHCKEENVNISNCHLEGQKGLGEMPPQKSCYTSVLPNLAALENQTSILSHLNYLKYIETSKVTNIPLQVRLVKVESVQRCTLAFYRMKLKGTSLCRKKAGMPLGNGLL